MKALVRFSDTPGDFGMAEVREPAVVPGKVKIKIAYCGICGSDIHIYNGFESGLPQGIHGHEFSGVISEVGEEVEDYHVGDKVTAEHTFSTCGVCEYCKTGRYHLCAKRKSIGFDQQGGFTEYIVVDPQYIHRVPDRVDLKSAALTEPLACIIHAIDKVDIQPTQRILIVGPGPMGILAGLTLLAYGCAVDIMGTLVDRERLEIAAKHGMNVIEKAESNFYPIVVECSGSNGGINICLDAVKKGGTILQIAIATKEITLPYHLLVYKELCIQATFCHVWKDWEQALSLQRDGLLDLSPVITEIEPLENWETGFDAMIEKKGLKVLLEV